MQRCAFSLSFVKKHGAEPSSHCCSKPISIARFMQMELQGKTATHDLLLLYNKIPAPSLARQDSGLLHRRGFHLKTQDLLGPLEKRDGDSDPSTERAEHVLPGGIGTYTITHVAAPDHGECAVGHGASTDRKPPEPFHYAAGEFQPAGFYPVSSTTTTTDCWPLPSAGRATTTTTIRPPPLPSPSGLHPSPVSKKWSRPLMETSQRSGRGFADDEDDDEGVYSRREGSASRDLTVKTPDGKAGEQKQPTTPRSKHSATEQRRRSKINDRFQILRELLPHNDQKRDKASFLLEVIEYIRFLQEKVQKYEASPGWTQENTKLMPWKLPRDAISDNPDVLKDASMEPEYIFSGKFDDNIPVSPTMLSSAQNPTESELSAGVSYKLLETPVFSAKAAAIPVSMQTNPYDNMASQSQWFRPPCPADSTVNSSTLYEQGELTIDEGTVSVSTAYSQELLTTLTQSMQSSGVDLSQASISVEINLGKRAISRPAATTAVPGVKDQHDPSFGARAMGHSSVGSNGEEPKQVTKKHKSSSS